MALLIGLNASGPASSQPAPYEIHAILSLTGADAFIGNEEAAALAIAQDVVNASGGIHGQPVRFVVDDDASAPQTGVQLLTGLAGKGVPIVLGSTVAALCNATSPLVERGGPVEYCFSPIISPRTARSSSRSR